MNDPDQQTPYYSFSKGSVTRLSRCELYPMLLIHLTNAFHGNSKMHLKSIFVLATLSATAVADSVLVSKRCIFSAPTSWACATISTWYTNTNSYTVDSADACRSAGVPYIYQVCFDWGKQRAHFLAQGQNKRCLKITSSTGGLKDCGTNRKCEEWRWTEVPCTWRVANDAVRGEKRAALPEPDAEPEPVAIPVAFEA